MTDTASPLNSSSVTSQQATESSVGTQDNTLKRSHPEYDDKTKDELVEEEKKKIKTIHTIVNEVKEDTQALEEKIAEARSSNDLEERQGLIDDIQVAATEVQDKVITAAKLENDVAEINAVLKSKQTEASETTPTNTEAPSTLKADTPTITETQNVLGPAAK